MFWLALEAVPVFGFHDVRHGASAEVAFNAVFAENVGASEIRCDKCKTDSDDQIGTIEWAIAVNFIFVIFFF